MNIIHNFLRKLKKHIYTNRFLRIFSFFYTLYVLFPEVRRRHIGLLGASESYYFEIRREIHRIEKGLSFKVKRKTFGRDSILRISELLTLENIQLDFQTEGWCFNVLDNYIREGCPPDCLKDALLAKAKLGASLDEKQRPYLPQNIIDISPDAICSLMGNRRSIRFFENEIISERLVSSLVTQAATSPSACNRLPFSVIALQGEQAAECCAIAAGTAGWSGQVNNLLVLKYSCGAYTDPKDFKAPIVDASLFAMQFLLLLEAYKFGGCIINWGEMKNREILIRRKIKIKKHESIVCLIAFGKPDRSVKVPSSIKRMVNSDASF